MQSSNDNAAVHQRSGLSSGGGPESQNLAPGALGVRRGWAGYPLGSLQPWNSTSWEAHNGSHSSSLVLVSHLCEPSASRCYLRSTTIEEREIFSNLILAIVTVDKRPKICIQPLHTPYPLWGGDLKCQTNLFFMLLIPTIQWRKKLLLLLTFKD